MTFTCRCGAPLEFEDELKTTRCRGCRAYKDYFTNESWIERDWFSKHKEAF